MSNSTLKNDQRLLRDAFSSFATGITVVTAVKQGKPVGMTVNSFSSVSLEPPLVSWCVGDQATLFDFFKKAEFFAINVLSQQQRELSDLFAKGDDDCFNKSDWQKGVNDLPLLTGCVANFQCQTAHRYPGGDHVILVGRVLDFNSHSEEPLVFFGGKYCTLTQRG